MHIVHVPPGTGEVFVAKQCDHCGKILPADNIKYCPGCGKLVASSRPVKRSLSGDPPAWMKQLETSLTNDRSQLPLRELNVKVWDEEAAKSDSVAMSEVDSVEDDQDAVEDNQDVVDALPTSPLTVTHTPQSNSRSSFAAIDGDRKDATQELPTNPHMTAISQNTPVNQPGSLPGRNTNNGLKSHDQVEKMETRPYIAQPRSIVPEMEMPVSYQQRSVMQTPAAYKNGSATQRPVTPLPLTFTQNSSEPPAMQRSSGSPPVPPLARAEKRSRKGLVIMLALLFTVLLGSAIAWIRLAQPFSVPEITTTTQHFTNATLGVSLEYPRDWTIVVHTQSGAVNLYDDNHTDQVNITVVAVDSQGLNQYTAKMVSSLGMTGQRTLAEPSFAGPMWQQVQGSVQQSGASYTATLFATTHDGHYYTILQLAPSSTYPLEEQLVFSKMRSSFQF